jgi:hypothetical protein
MTAIDFVEISKKVAVVAVSIWIFVGEMTPVSNGQGRRSDSRQLPGQLVVAPKSSVCLDSKF